MDDEVISEEFLAELRRSPPFAEPRDAFMRQWLEEHCNEEDAALMKAVWAHLWGPGPVTNHTNHLTATMGRAPTHDEVAALIDHTLRVLEPCNEAWCESPEDRQLQLIHYGRRL